MPSDNQKHKPKLKNLSPKALRAMKALRGVKVVRTPAKLRSPKYAQIRRAVRDYYLG